jgi:hypothetical protein
MNATPPDLDLREKNARIDRAQAEIEKLVAEQRKLAAEQTRLNLELTRLHAAAVKRERLLASWLPIAVVIGAIGGTIAGIATVVQIVGAIPG